ncbi:hypothetical protein GCM10028774_61150 [Spirosoma jeollabukense]
MHKQVNELDDEGEKNTDLDAEKYNPKAILWVILPYPLLVKQPVNQHYVLS